MLTNIGNAAVGVNPYISYFTKFISALSGFPRPVADRAHFLSWISARTVLAMAAVNNATQAERESVAQKHAREVRMLLIAAITVLDELADELMCYEGSPERYEEEWRRSGLIQTSFRGIHSRRFDMKELKTRAWEISLKPSAGLETAEDIGRHRRQWLEVLLEKIHARVGSRKEVNFPLQSIYEHCNRLSPDNPERQTLERLVAAIWKRGEEMIGEEEVWKLDQTMLGLISDLGNQAARSWRL
jgi:hypothetical protein